MFFGKHVLSPQESGRYDSVNKYKLPSETSLLAYGNMNDT